MADEVARHRAPRARRSSQSRRRQRKQRPAVVPAGAAERPAAAPTVAPVAVAEPVPAPTAVAVAPESATAARIRDLSDVPLAPPSANNGLFAVFRKRYLLRLLVRREISARYQGSFLGLLWSYINPMMQFFVYWAVIGGIMGLHKETPNFPIHLFAGLVIVHFFTETFGAGTRSIVRNGSIVKRMSLPREMFPVATMLVSLYHVVPAAMILCVVCLANGWMPDPGGIAAMFLALLMVMLLGTAVALVFSVANVFLRDFGNIVNVLQMFVRFGVPMIYPFSMVAHRFDQKVFGHPLSEFYLFNPLAEAVLLFQRAFWVNTPVDADRYPGFDAAHELPGHLMTRGLIFVGISIVLLVLAQVMFSRLENKIPERL